LLLASATGGWWDIIGTAKTPAAAIDWLGEASCSWLWYSAVRWLGPPVEALPPIDDGIREVVVHVARLLLMAV
jgi:hypothetical protein